MSKKGISSGAFSDKSTITSVSFGNKCTYVGKDAFKNCISLNKINDDNVIEEIYDGAFENCSNLKYINIQNCKEISNNTFRNCSSLLSINAKTCENVGDYAFYNCINLKDINFKNFYNIGSYAFSECKSIENVNLDNCKTIGECAFSNCENLNQITFSSNLVLDSGISDYAFLNCEKLSKVYINIPLNDKCIPLGNNVFYVGSEINSNIRFYLPPDIISQYKEDSSWGEYSNYMFALAGENQIVYTTNDNIAIDIDNDEIIDNIYGLIEFQYTVNKLNQHFFKGKNTLTSVILPSKCEEVGDYAFEDCENLNSFVPSYLNTLRKIGDCAFKNCKSFTSFTIPESITELGEGIFAGCSNIEKFEGKFVEYNGKAIVYNNTLISVSPKDDVKYYKISDINSNITQLGRYCFSGCTELRRIDIPSNITSIGDCAFEGCTNLREVHFYGDLNNIPKIGQNVFGNFDKEEDVKIKIFVPEKYLVNYCKQLEGYIDYIYPMPNDNCIIYYAENKLTTVESNNVNKSVTNGNYFKISNVSNELPKEYFSKQTTISKVIIGEKITKINNDAFNKCTCLEYIYLPNSLTKIGGRVFQECEKLDDILIPNNVDTIASDCFGKSGIKEFNINDGSKLKKISKRTFINCSNLSIVNLSKSKILDLIDDYAFSYCENLTDVKLSNTIVSIGDFAFAGCDKISSITLPSELKKLGDLCLSTTSEICIYIPYSLSTPPIFTKSGYESDTSYPFNDCIPQIFVPSDLEDIYKNDKYWGKYTEYIKTY